MASKINVMSKLSRIIFAFLTGFFIFVVIGFFVENRNDVYRAGRNLGGMVGSGSYDFNFSNRNYASKKMRVEKTQATVTSGAMVDQKYQKISTIGTTSESFDTDEQKLRTIIKSVDALVQYEKNAGLGTRRQLQMAIGVQPQDFDALVAQLKELGKLVEFRSDVTDKTNEFKELQAQRESLQSFRNSLIQLKSKSGKIEELINLEDRILKVEKELQGLGVNLGEFDSENEFSTIKYTLRETKKAVVVSDNNVMVKMAKAIQWALLYYGITIFLFTLFLIGSWIFLKVVNELKILNRTYRMLKEDGEEL